MACYDEYELNKVRSKVQRATQIQLELLGVPQMNWVGISNGTETKIACREKTCV